MSERTGRRDDEMTRGATVPGGSLWTRWQAGGRDTGISSGWTAFVLPHLLISPASMVVSQLMTAERGLVAKPRQPTDAAIRLGRDCCGWCCRHSSSPGEPVRLRPADGTTARQGGCVRIKADKFAYVRIIFRKWLISRIILQCDFFERAESGLRERRALPGDFVLLTQLRLGQGDEYVFTK